MEIKEYIKMRKAQKAERDPALTVSPGSVSEKRKMPAMVYYYDEDGGRQCLGRVEVNIEEPDMLDGEDVEEYWHQMNERAKKWILEDFEVDILDALISDSQNK